MYKKPNYGYQTHGGPWMFKWMGEFKLHWTALSQFIVLGCASEVLGSQVQWGGVVRLLRTGMTHLDIYVLSFAIDTSTSAILSK